MREALLEIGDRGLDDLFVDACAVRGMRLVAGSLFQTGDELRLEIDS